MVLLIFFKAADTSTGIPFQKRRKAVIDLLAFQQKSLDRALFLYILIYEIRLSGIRASTTIVHIRKFYEM